MRSFLLFFLLIGLLGCNAPAAKSDYYSLPAITENGVQAVIEISAGASLKLEYDAKKRSFLADSLDGQARVIDFLPYPANYGFIPSTLMDRQRGGDGDPLDILVLCAGLPTGTVLSVRLIGMLELLDDGELDTKIIAVPADLVQRTIQVDNFQDFFVRYDGARRILEIWFQQYKGIGKTEIKGWKDENAALAEVKKWMVR